MEMDLKGFGPFEIKDLVKGEVEAVVNTLGIVDRDRDVILPGAVKSGIAVKMSAYGHDVVGGAPPAGKGMVTEENNRLVFRGSFFMATTRGREAFEVVKALGADGEWSIGFSNVKTAELTDEWKEKGARRVISSLELREVSPVFVGSNPKTATLAVKSSDSPDCLIVKWEDRTLNVPYIVEDGAVVLLGDAVDVTPTVAPPKTESETGEQELLTRAFANLANASALVQDLEVREAALGAHLDDVRERESRFQQEANLIFDRMQRTAKKLGVA